MTKFGIITPTFRRTKFLSPFIRNIKRQTYSRWSLAIVHDGPESGAVAETVYRVADGDGRIVYMETPVHTRNMGIGPRLFGMQKLAEMVPSAQYYLLWDDDNLFYPDALARIDTAIQDAGTPDLLLVPLKHKGRSIPSRGVPSRAIPVGGVDTANLCVKADVAIKHYAKAQQLSDFYHQDFYFYRSLCDDVSVTVSRADIGNIGRYDGLRFWETLRWMVWPQPLNIYDTAFMRRVRRLLPRS